MKRACTRQSASAGKTFSPVKFNRVGASAWRTRRASLSPRPITLIWPLPPSYLSLVVPSRFSGCNAVSPCRGRPSRVSSAFGLAVKNTASPRRVTFPSRAGPMASTMALSLALPMLCVPGSSQCRPIRLSHPSGVLRAASRCFSHCACSAWKRAVSDDSGTAPGSCARTDAVCDAVIEKNVAAARARMFCCERGVFMIVLTKFFRCSGRGSGRRIRAARRGSCCRCSGVWLRGAAPCRTGCAHPLPPRRL